MNLEKSDSPPVLQMLIPTESPGKAERRTWNTSMASQKGLLQRSGPALPLSPQFGTYFIKWEGDGKGKLKPCLHFSSWCCLCKTPPARCFGVCGVCFFFTADIKRWLFFFFFVTCFRYQCFLKSRCVSQGGSSLWGSGCEVHVLSLAMLQHCSWEMLSCTGSRGSHQGGILHPRSRTCSSTSNGIQWFCLFVFLI